VWMPIGIDAELCPGVLIISRFEGRDSKKKKKSGVTILRFEHI
jgi:hypothetical protein